MWIYDIKWDGEGNRIKDKARLVGKGYTQLVFESPVQSGLLTLRDMDRDRDRDQSTITIKGQKTGLDRSRPVFCGLWTGPGLNRSQPIFCLQIYIFVSIIFVFLRKSFRMSLETFDIVKS
jgi:hypothetical protein